MSLETSVQLLNQYFDHIYLITIPRSWEKRKEKLQKNLAGIRYSVFEGFDGKQHKPEEIAALSDEKKGSEYLDFFHVLRYGKPVYRNLTPSEVGCGVSHNWVFRDILEKGYDKVLILEDDAMIWEPGLSAFPKMLKELPPDWDLWYLGYRWHDCESLLARVKRKSLLALKFIVNPSEGKKEHTRQKTVYPKYWKKHIWKAGLHAGTHAYAIRRKTAEKLWAENTPVYLSSDMLLAKVYLDGKITSYISVPQVFKDDQSFETTILHQ
ncbi:MAG: glycosyltransferase family 25 protein [Flavobacteriales bacterium]|nr:glycosyltransferase family 25 protein [Flavobacteriales bacterium]MDW8432114.1 glycosyltransferase family 25 protein [Flavobacteriales bacterium]